MGLLNVLFLFLMSCSEEAAVDDSLNQAITKEQIVPGITITQLRSVFPEAGINSLGQFSVAETIHGLSGTWEYTFTGERLSWAIFDAEFTDINEETFYLCRNSTESIIDEFSQQYGDPQNIEKGVQTFRDPELDPHWGYTVVKASWQTGEILRQVQFVFQGGRGEKLSLRVSIDIRN